MSKSTDNRTIVKFLLKFLSKNSKQNNNNNDNIEKKSRPKLKINLSSPSSSTTTTTQITSINNNACIIDVNYNNYDNNNNVGANLLTLICRIILAILLILFIFIQFFWLSWYLWFYQTELVNSLIKISLFTMITFIDIYLFYIILLWLISTIKLMKRKINLHSLKRKRQNSNELQNNVTTPMSALTLQSLSLVSNYFDVSPSSAPTPMIIPTINVRLAQEHDHYVNNDDYNDINNELKFESIKFIDDSKSINRKVSTTSSLSSIDMITNYLNKLEKNYLRKNSQDLAIEEKLTSSNESLQTECSKFYRDSII